MNGLVLFNLVLLLCNNKISHAVFLFFFYNSIILRAIIQIFYYQFCIICNNDVFPKIVNASGSAMLHNTLREVWNTKVKKILGKNPPCTKCQIALSCLVSV